jgi:chromosomal replication initiator protein
MNLPAVSSSKQELREYYQWMWSDILAFLMKTHDPRKIAAFLWKCCIEEINTTTNTVIIFAPHQFVKAQVDRFFAKGLQSAVNELLSPQFIITILEDTKLTWEVHPHTIDVIKFIRTMQPKNTATNIQTAVHWQRWYHENSLITSSDASHQEKVTNTPSWSAQSFTSRRLDTNTKSILVEFFGIMFEPKFTFDKLIVGSHNQLAYAAARSVAEAPGQEYNPLFLYGDVWLGKTHLLQAIGNYTITNHPDTCILYLPTTKFVDLVVDAITKRKINELLDKFKQVDIIMLDDIQFLSNKIRTQEVFHNIFNELVAQKKQIVLTSDQAPMDMEDMEKRIKSRLSTGLTVDIKSPDIETRLAIIKMKIQAKWEQLDDEFIEIIAKELKGNIREIEGLINILIMKKQHGTNGHITQDDIYQALQTLGYHTHAPSQAKHDKNKQDARSRGTHTNNATTTISNQTEHLLHIVQQLSHEYSVNYTDVLGDGRTKQVSQVRQLTMRIAKKKFHRTLEKIGAFFGGKNHASVIYNIKVYEENTDISSKTHETRIAQILDNI